MNETVRIGKNKVSLDDAIGVCGVANSQFDESRWVITIMKSDWSEKKVRWRYADSDLKAAAKDYVQHTSARNFLEKTFEY